MELAQLPPAPLIQGGKLEKRKSKLPEIHSAGGAEQPPMASTASSKVVSSSLKALSSVTSHFSKLNPISKLKAASKGGQNSEEIPQINIENQR